MWHGTARRTVERLGTSSTITAIAIALSVGLALAFVVLASAAQDRQQAAQVSGQFAATSERTVDLITVLHEEQVRAAVLTVTGADEDRDAYEAAIAATDHAAARLDTSWQLVRPAVPDRSIVTGFDDVLAGVRSLMEVRESMLAGTLEDSAEVYGGLLVSSRDALSDQAYAVEDVQLRLRRATSALLAAAAASADRRNLGIEVLAGEVEREEAEVRAARLAADFAGAVGRATQASERDLAGLEDEVRGVVDQLRTAVDAGRAREVITELYVTGASEAQLAEWVESSTLEVTMSLDAAAATQGAATTAALAIRDAARLEQRRLTVGFGVLLALALVGGVASVVAARERDRALESHRTLVRGILSWFQLPPGAVSGVEVETRMVAAEQLAGAGGDFFDVFRDPNGGVVALIGDVAGHDAGAVARMAEVRNKVRGLAHRLSSGPAEVLRSVDSALEVGPMTTVFLVRLLPDGRTAVYSRAGHLPAMLLRQDGSVETLEGPADLPLGVVPAAPRQQAVVDLHEGDVLVLYTDGLVEDPARDLEDSLADLASAVAELWADDLGGLADGLVARRPSANDDVAVMVLRRSEPPPDPQEATP